MILTGATGSEGSPYRAAVRPLPKGEGCLRQGPLPCGGQLPLPRETAIYQQGRWPFGDRLPLPEETG